MIMESVVSALNFDKSDWTLTKFGDVAIQQKETVDRDDTHLSRYVKGEHMGSEDLHLREWGELTDEYLGPAFIRKFDEGDILYGSRRTYLRKVVVAPFSGITSNTTFVIKANVKKIDKRLLPFVMMSEGFTENSIRNSKGSVNPYINWKDIANYEFLLPPKDQQAKLAELLWAMDEVIEKEVKILYYLNDVQNAVMRKIKSQFFSKTESEQEKPNVKHGRIDSFFKLQRGFDLTKKDSLEGKYPVISSSGITYYHNNYKCEGPGVITGRKGKIGDVYYFNGPHWPHDTTLWVKDFCGNVPKFVYWFLKSINLENYNAATAVPTLNRNTIHPVKVKFPNIEFQSMIADRLDAISSCITNAESKVAKSKSLQKSLINQIF